MKKFHNFSLKWRSPKFLSKTFATASRGCTCMRSVHALHWIPWPIAYTKKRLLNLRLANRFLPTPQRLVRASNRSCFPLQIRHLLACSSESGLGNRSQYYHYQICCFFPPKQYHPCPLGSAEWPWTWSWSPNVSPPGGGAVNKHLDALQYLCQCRSVTMAIL